MDLDKKQIENLANLAKLQLTDKEIETYQQQLSGVLGYVDKLNKLDLFKIKESLSGAEEREMKLREDKIGDSDGAAIDQACQLKDGYVVTPQALKK